MPGPITHIVLTDKIFDRFFDGMDRKDFFIGTLFPDIRYLKVIERSKTHIEGIGLIDILNEDSFTAGLKFHSIIDDARRKFISEHDIYAPYETAEHPSMMFKIAEDMFFYDFIEDWSQYISFFDHISPAERSFAIPEETLQNWHSIVQQYLKYLPGEKTIKALTMIAGLSNKAALKMSEYMKEIQADNNIRHKLEYFYHNIEVFINKSQGVA